MSSDRFHIACPGCDSKVAVSLAHVGKKGRCPACKTVFPITAPAGPEPVVAELVPVSTPGLQPLSSGLQPSGFQPLGSSGLQPLAAPGLQPIAQPAWQGSSIPNPYGQSAPASPFGQPAPANYGQPTSPFGQSGNGDGGYQLASDPNPYAAPSAASSFNFAPAKPQPHTDDSGINGSLWGGVAMMVGAVVWFVGGLFFDIIFFYPPIRFIIGLVAFVKGLVNLGSNR